MADLSALNILLDDEDNLQPHNDEEDDHEVEDGGERDLRENEKDENQAQTHTEDGKGDQTDGGKSDLQEGEEEENDLQAAADDRQQTDETEENERICGLCDVPLPETATNCYCIQCCMFICRSCLQIHKKIPTSKHHTITDAAEESTEECREPEYSYCKRHNNVQMKYYCTACRLPICAECQIVNHRQHDITEIEQEVEAVKSRLGKAREVMQARLTDEQKHRAELEKKLSEFVSYQKTVEEDLEENKRSRLNNIKQSYAEVEKANGKVCAEYTTEIRKALERVDQRIQQLNQTIDELVQLAGGKGTKTDYVCLVIPDVENRDEPETTAAPHPQLVQQVGSISRQTGVQTSGSVTRDMGSQTSDGVSRNRSMQACERCAPEGRITFRAINITQFQPGVRHYRHDATVNNVPWSIGVARYRTDDGDYLACAIVCNRNRTLPSSFRVRASVSLRLIHPTSEQLTKELEYTYTFTKDRSVEGNSKFHPWQGLGDDGFISDRGIQLEATIKVLETSHSLPCPDC